MSKILVVDDSAVARHAITRILSQDQQLSVGSVVDGQAALEDIANGEPDVVITDLVMPKMNGFELVAELRRTYPHIPAILVTSEGSEDIAAQALREGASSYVPKEALEQDLLSTVHRILALSKVKRTRLALLSKMTTADLNFVLDNDPEWIPPLIEYLQECMRQMCYICPADLIRISVALEEALANALYHGNLEVSSDLRNQPGSAFYKLAAQRRLEEPYRDRKIRAKVSLNSDSAKFVIRDEGPGFDHKGLPDPTDSTNLDKLSGRGVMLMMTFLDDVSYNENGNEVTLIKNCDNDEDG